MVCVHCGAFTDSEQTICPNCQQNPKVTILPPEERENFNGLTIDNETGYNQSQKDHSTPHIYFRHFSFGASKGNLLLKLLIGAIILMVIIFALPIVLISVAVFIVFFIINKVFIHFVSH